MWSGAASGPRLCAVIRIARSSGSALAYSIEDVEVAIVRRTRRYRAARTPDPVRRGAGCRSIELAVRKRRLRVLVEQAHVRVGRRVVDVEVVLLHVLAVIALVRVDAEQPLLQVRIALVPERGREAQQLVAVADAPRCRPRPSGTPWRAPCRTSGSPKRCRRESSPRERCPTTDPRRKDPSAAIQINHPRSRGRAPARGRLPSRTPSPVRCSCLCTPCVPTLARQPSLVKLCGALSFVAGPRARSTPSDPLRHDFFLSSGLDLAPHGQLRDG